MKISLYIHIPFCKSKCDYCDFFSVPVSSYDAGSTVKSTIDSIIAETDYRLKLIPDPEIVTVFIGGGTPSVLEASLNQYFYDKLTRIISPYLVENAEFTTEANPESCSPDFLKTVSQAGVNRLSLGVQSFDLKKLRLIGRSCYPDNIKEKLTAIRSEWQNDLSLDIISGIDEYFLNDLETAVSYNPDHLSVYQLTIENNTKLYSDISCGIKKKPDDALQSETISAVNNYLAGKKYNRYEISNYSKNGYECRHNLNYWNMQSYIGVGPSAVSSLYSDTEQLRITNTDNIEKYNMGISGLCFESIQQRENLSRLDFMVEHFIMGCRLTEGIDENLFRKRFGDRSFNLIPETVEKWSEKNLYDTVNMRLNDNGLLFLDGFLADVYEELTKM